MKFFFPDSQDMVDPSFDFVKETRSEHRVRQRDDKYCHEVFGKPPYDGMLVSKGIVDGLSGGTGKYTMAQRARLLRVGVREFFRLEDTPIQTMGDCGAFSYVREKVPPFSVDEVMEFYVDCGFDYIISVDHVILGFNNSEDDDVPKEWPERQEITLELAAEFFNTHKKNKLKSTPMGVAQGWSPKSYAHAVAELQKIGYRRIALGGMVPLKTPEILASLAAIQKARKPDTGFHLLGVTRTEEIRQFAKFGVVSFDSTSPLRRAFKDARHNFYTMDRTYSAIRVPQVEANPKLSRNIKAGIVDGTLARKHEQACLQAMRDFDAGKLSVEDTVRELREYEKIHDDKHDRTEIYREVLTDAPWKKCSCEICKRLGINVIMFRGAERNRRRGFHNVWVFAQQVRAKLGGRQTQFAYATANAGKKNKKATAAEASV